MVEMLTDERSEIAERLSSAAASWARHDALDSREPAAELGLILDVINELNARRLRIAELEADLRQAKSALLEIRDRAVLMPNGGSWSAGLAALCIGTMKSKQD